MDLIEAISATYAVLGQEVPDIALEVVVQELQQYPRGDVEEALTRCRRELRKLTLADILDRLPSGHPGPEEAWGLVASALNNEQVSIVWTNEMAQAMGVARSLSGDPIAARMAFKETYSRLLVQARLSRSRPVWLVSLGYDQAGREAAYLEQARRKGKELPALPEPKGVPMPDDLRKQIATIGKAMPETKANV